jgi:hypothetical protein
MIKSRRAGHLERIGRRGMYIGYWRESQKKRDHWEEQDVGGWIMLGWILERQNGMTWIGLMWLKTGTKGGVCEDGIQPSGSIKCWEVLEWLHNSRLLKKGSAP